MVDHASNYQQVLTEILAKANLNVTLVESLANAHQSLNYHLWSMILIHVEEEMHTDDLFAFTKKANSLGIQIGILSSITLYNISEKIKRLCSFVESIPVKPNILLSQIKNNVSHIVYNEKRFAILNLSIEFLNQFYEAVLHGELIKMEESIKSLKETDEITYYYLMDKLDMFDYTSLLAWVEQQKEGAK